MKSIISLIVAIVMFLSPSLSVSADGIQSNKEIVKTVRIGEGHERVYYENTIIDDIITDDYRKIVTKSENDVSIYYEDFSTGIATMSQNGQVAMSYNMNEMREDYSVWTMPEEDAMLLKEYFGDLHKSMEKAMVETLPQELEGKYTVVYDNNGCARVEPISESTYSVRAATIVRPVGSVTDTFPEYMFKEIESKLKYSVYCGRYLDMSIKDSRYNYRQTSKETYNYIAGTAVAVIAGALSIAVGTLIDTLAGVIDIVSGVWQLTSTIEYYYSEKYIFEALRQVYVYDYTYNNRDVSVVTEYGEGEISLVWGWDKNENVHVDPHYAFSEPAYPHTISPSTLYNEAKEVWEYNMQEVGYWKWGDI